MATRASTLYRVTYRRQGWRAGREKSVVKLSLRGAQNFAGKLHETENVSAVDYVSVDVAGVVWTPIPANELRTPVRRKSRATDPYAVDLSKMTFEEDDDED